MYTLLFVDDQREILNAIRRTLMQQMDDWDVHVANSGDEALQMIEAISFDVVITDIKMPQMNGAELLEKVAEKHPSSLRFVLSGYTERDLVYRTIGNVHQFLSKPMDVTLLIEAIRKAIEFRDRLLPENIQAMVNGLKNLPSIPSIYNELMDALGTANVSLGEVSDIIQKDVALTARVMQLVNSSFFASPVYVSGPAHAVSLLGTEIMKGLVVSSYTFSTFKESDSRLFSLPAFERHCLEVGALAKKIAQEETNNQLIIDDSFIGGLLHDIGKLVLASEMPDLYDQINSRAIDQGIPQVDVELEELGTTHAEIGAYLLAAWGFRNDIVEAVTYQHKPGAGHASSFSPLTAVHVANSLCHNNEFELLYKSIGIDEQYLEDIHVLDRVNHWKSISSESLNTPTSHGSTNLIC